MRRNGETFDRVWTLSVRAGKGGLNEWIIAKQFS